MGEQPRLSPKHHLEPSEFRRRSSTRKSKMKLSSALGLALVLTIVLLLVVPEAESKSIRPHRGALARRAMGMGGARGMRAKMANRKSKKGGRGKRGPGRRVGERTDAGADVRTKSPRLTWCRMTEDPGTEGMSARFSCSTVGTGHTV